MALFSKLKSKVISRHSFKKNELATMGPGEIPKKAPAKKVKKNGK